MIKRFRSIKEVGYKIICSNYDQVVDAIKSGEWFRTDSMDWIYKSVPVETVDGVEVPEGIYCLRRVCVTSPTTQFTYFYHIINSETTKNKIYSGKALEDKICKEIKAWIKEVNPKTLRGFSGKSFVSYLNAIPKELYLNGNFEERVKKSLTNGFVDRMQKLESGDAKELEDIFNLSKTTREIVEANKSSAKAKSGKIAGASLKEFEKIKQQKIDELKRLK